MANHAHHIINSVLTGSRSPAGLRRLGTATRISASLSRRLSAFFESTSRPRSQSGKVRRSDTRPGDVCERAERSEGSDTTPIRNAPCFAVCAVVCDFSPKGERVPPFACESKREPFVREVEKQDEKRLGDKIYGSSFARFFSSAGVEGSQRTGKCMYIKAWRNIRYFAGGTKPHCGRGREGPCFAVCAIVYGSLSKAECIPLSPAKANVGHLCEKLKNGMRSSLEQHCGGNFLPIFAGMVLGKKPNFTGRFFEWRKPFDFSTR